MKTFYNYKAVTPSRSQSVLKVIQFLKKLRVHYCVHQGLHPVSILREVHPAHTLNPVCFINVTYNCERLKGHFMLSPGHVWLEHNLNPFSCLHIHLAKNV